MHRTNLPLEADCPYSLLVTILDEVSDCKGQRYQGIKNANGARSLICAGFESTSPSLSISLLRQ